MSFVRVGARVINLEWVVAAENHGERVDVYLFGLSAPFQFEGAERGGIWAAVTQGAKSPEQLVAASLSPFATDYVDSEEPSDGQPVTAEGIPDGMAASILADLESERPELVAQGAPGQADGEGGDH